MFTSMVIICQLYYRKIVKFESIKKKITWLRYSSVGCLKTCLFNWYVLLHSYSQRLVWMDNHLGKAFLHFEWVHFSLKIPPRDLLIRESLIYMWITLYVFLCCLFIYLFIYLFFWLKKTIILKKLIWRFL